MVFLLTRMSNMFDPTMMMNADDPMFASQISEFIQGCAGFATGATVAVILRLFARWHHSKKMSSDDIAITLSLLPLWALSGIGIEIALYGGLAKKVHSLTVQEEAVYYPSVFVASILYALAITAAKLSILLLYRRIFTGLKFWRLLNFFMAVCVVWCVAVILLAIFRCNPIRTSWSTHRQIHRLPHQCIPLTNVYYGTSISNLILDVVVNLLPVRQIWKLQLPLRQRILLIICLSFGIISIASGIGRILTIPPLNFSELPGAIAPTETIAMPYLFLIVENAFAIICACLPTYRPLIIWSAERLGDSRIGSRMKSLVSTQLGTGRDSTLKSNTTLSAGRSNHDRTSRISWACLGLKSNHRNTAQDKSLESSDMNDKLGLIGTTSTQIVPGPSSITKSNGIVISQSWSTSTTFMNGLDVDTKEEESRSASTEVGGPKR